ncbi:MAG TPA: hypothetical protein VGQ59_05805 [Cyclobacteriaceae bacterium]|jgi:hypothetical protein|nr:hypothetical protein [Cyclobacteriaceae bacterium]
MEIDVTDIDKVKLLQTLYNFGSRFKRDKLAKDKAQNLIDEHNQHRGYRQIDYVEGVAIKLQYYINEPREVVSTYPCDYRHGTYAFLYAFISEFGYEKLIIVKKGYHRTFKPESGREFNNALLGKYLHKIDFEKIGIKRPRATVNNYPPYVAQNDRI